jgi:hypothetical protein
MTQWQEIVSSEPQFAARVRRIFDSRKHKTLATLRSDGSPRISGIEAKFIGETGGEGIEENLWFGSMPGSRKGADLARDPRFALHSGSDDPPEWRGDAKLAGVAEEVTDLERKREIFKAMGSEEVPDDSALYRVDVRELALTRLTEAKDELAISWWTEAGGLREVTRK